MPIPLSYFSAKSITHCRAAVLPLASQIELTSSCLYAFVHDSFIADDIHGKAVMIIVR